MSGAFSGDEVPSGVAADAFYQKGCGIRSLLRIIAGLTQPKRLPASPPATSAPLRIQRNDNDASGVPYVFDRLPGVPPDLPTNRRRFSQRDKRRPLRPLWEYHLLLNCRAGRLVAWTGVSKTSSCGKAARPAPVALLRNKKAIPMHNIAELTVLLRTRVELKSSLKPNTAEPREIWNFFTGDASKVDKKIRTSAWNFIKIAKGI